MSGWVGAVYQKRIGALYRQARGQRALNRQAEGRDLSTDRQGVRERREQARGLEADIHQSETIHRGGGAPVQFDKKRLTVHTIK